MGIVTGPPGRGRHAGGRRPLPEWGMGTHKGHMRSGE
jgi:hypothetical protein